MSAGPYRHRCYCCVGETLHESGVCVTCGGRGYLLDPAETLPYGDTVQHRRMLTTTGQTCKLTEEEREAALRFIAAGEPIDYEPVQKNEP